MKDLLILIAHLLNTIAKLLGPDCARAIVRPSTLLKLHQLLKQRKYRLLYSSCGNRKPAPKGSSRELIATIIGVKRPNPTFGCPRIAQPINLAFGITIDKDIVRRILAAH